jgi:hypothetical protein
MGLRQRLFRRRRVDDAEAGPAAELDRWFRDQSERLATVPRAAARIAVARELGELNLAAIRAQEAVDRSRPRRGVGRGAGRPGVPGSASAGSHTPDADGPQART